ncbi:CynX/NimT family MFS transporter [Paenibacillus soyae]|uniref:MFS transporter n=1 Tax=Paenibacillus soyae TaxID=2969249 RepID=A0A9X2MMU9_9BACL|nr:MFS transporter [Paenibacillus soyae]MCR2803220.1 MFS transporter [Paenibacillus soyae]
MNSYSQSSDKRGQADSMPIASGAKGGATLLVLGIVLVSLILRAPITAVGPIIDQIKQTLGLTAAMTGLLTTLPLLAFAAVSPIAPRLARRMGMEFSLLGSSVLLAAAIVVRSLPSTAALFIGTALMGAAIAVGNVLLPSLVKRDFPNKVGLMTGVYTVAMNLGAAIGSGISVPLTEGMGFSWQATLAATAAIAFIAAVAWLPLVRQASFSANRVEVSGAKGNAAGKLWRSPLAWIVSLFLALQSFCFYVNVTWIPLILTDKGLSHADAGWMLSLMQLIGMPATFVIPILAGKRRSQRGLALLTSSLIAVGYLILLVGGKELAALSMVVLGLGVGGGFGLALMLFALRTEGSGQAAELSGMAQAVGYLVAASGPLLVGWIHDWTGGWSLPLGVVLAVSAVYGLLGWTAGADRKV